LNLGMTGNTGRSRFLENRNRQLPETKKPCFNIAFGYNTNMKNILEFPSSVKQFLVKTSKDIDRVPLGIIMKNTKALES